MMRKARVRVNGLTNEFPTEEQAISVAKRVWENTGARVAIYNADGWMIWINGKRIDIDGNPLESEDS